MCLRPGTETEAEMKAGLAALFAVLIGQVILAAVSVTDVKVQQRWPWNGLVDIDYTLTDRKSVV